MDGYDVLRTVNVLTGTLAATWALLATSRAWDRMSKVGRARSMALVTYAFVATYGSGEAMVQSAQGGWRVLLVTLANLNLIAALAMQAEVSGPRRTR